VIGAIQNSEVFPLLVYAAPTGVRREARADRLNAGHGAYGLVFHVVAVDYTHRLALAQLGEKRLVKGPASTMNSRAFANTLDYDGADPLKD
jgi:hypothetical protein